LCADAVFHDKAAADASNELASEYVREKLGEFGLTQHRAECSGIYAAGARIARDIAPFLPMSHGTTGTHHSFT
jgi:hypothetical protein